jgi:hypothetical protein
MRGRFSARICRRENLSRNFVSSVPITFHNHGGILCVDLHPRGNAMADKIDWSRDAILGKRDTYFAATQRAFVPYQKPLIIRAIVIRCS